MFTVSDGLASSTTYEITINLVQPSQTAAAGAPTVMASDAPPRRPLMRMWSSPQS